MGQVEFCESVLHRANPGMLPSKLRSPTKKLRLPPAPKAGWTGAFLVPLERLRPTQAAVGMRSVDAKRGKLETRANKQKKIDRFLEDRPIPAVLGPGDLLYIVDHHHLGLALWQSDIANAYVSIIDDLSAMPRSHFWKFMEAEGRLHPFDESGRRIPPSRLPSSLLALRHDPYRDLAWSVREAGGFKKTCAPFSEFRWADYFREHISADILRHDYDASVRRALKLSRSRAAKGLPGFRG